MNANIEVFISHSTSDKEIAAALARLLEEALNIPNLNIRCTSVDGYKLPPGVDFKDILRNELAGAQAFIGIVTSASRESEYVMFELGARWGAGLAVLPLLAGGSSSQDLPKPLAEVTAANASNRAEVSQLIETIREKLGRSLRPEPEYLSKLQHLMMISTQRQQAHVDAILERRREICAAVVTRQGVYDIWVPPELKGRRLKTLRNRLKLSTSEKVIAWIENSTHGTDGLAVLPRGIAWRNGPTEPVMRRAWEDLRSLSIISVGRRGVLIGGLEVDLRFSGAEGGVVAQLLTDLVNVAGLRHEVRPS